MKPHAKLIRIQQQLIDAKCYDLAKALMAALSILYPQGKGMFVGTQQGYVMQKTHVLAQPAGMNEIPGKVIRHICAFASALSLRSDCAHKSVAADIMQELQKHNKSPFVTETAKLIRDANWVDSKETETYRWLISEKSVPLSQVINDLTPLKQRYTEEFNGRITLPYPIGNFLAGEEITITGNKYKGWIITCPNDQFDKIKARGGSITNMYMERHGNDPEILPLFASQQLVY